MTVSDTYDIAVVGGGLLGCTAALHLAFGGMRVVVLEAKALCRQASGVNAGGVGRLPRWLRRRAERAGVAAIGGGGGAPTQLVGNGHDGGGGPRRQPIPRGWWR